jgi:hypothetical protein
MSEISSAFLNASTTSGPLATYLGTSTQSATAANIIGGSSGSSGGGALAALQTSAGSTIPSTAAALGQGKLTNRQHRVIQALGDATGPLNIPWNANGSEPSVLAQLRTAGWIKLDKKNVADGKRSGDYELTKVGQAIYQRTGGGSASDQGLTGADTASTLTGLLSGLGVSV